MSPRIQIAPLRDGIAGRSKDGKTIYLDPLVPSWMKSAIREHEMAELRFMQDGMSYAGAHQKATARERQYCERNGIDWPEYDRTYKRVLAAVEARKPKPVEPPDLFHGDKGERPMISKTKDAAGHEHASDGKFSSTGGGGGKSPKETGSGKEHTRQRLSNNERNAIDNYKRTGYAKVNAHLRRGDKAHMSPDDRKAATTSIKQLDAIISRSPLKKEMRVFRGVGDPEIFKNFDQLKGATISDAGFISTSRSVDIAAQHARSANMGIKQKGKPVKGIIAVMKLPKGTKAISLGEDDSEKEVICQRGSSFRVVNTDKSGPYWRIDLEAVT